MNGNFKTISGHFFANYTNNVDKTEVQMVILRCLTSLNLNWFKSYGTKGKYFYFHFFAILWQKTLLCFLGFWVLCHNFYINWVLDLLSTSKWPSEPQFCERCLCSWWKNGQKWSYNSHLSVSFEPNQSIGSNSNWIIKGFVLR